MEKLTPEQAKATKIIKSAYFEGKWTVIATDTDGVSYVLNFTGTSVDSDATVLYNTYLKLVETDKVAPVEISEPVIKDLSGQSPIDKIIK